MPDAITYASDLGGHGRGLRECLYAQFLACLMLFITGCVSVPQEWKNQRYEGPFSWPMRRYENVVGYAFESPKWDQGFLSEHGIDIQGLNKHATARSTLSKDQVQRLVGATIKPVKAFPMMNCYFPHHIFVFYEKDNAVAAIEVCFSCNLIQTWPSAGSAWGWDFATLAILAEELKLGLGSPGRTLNSYLRSLAGHLERKARQKTQVP